MSIQVGYPGHTENPTLIVDMLGRDLDSNPPEAMKLTRELEGSLAELVSSASFTTVTKLEQVKADAQAAIAELEQRIEDARAQCGPAVLEDPARVTAAAKTIRKAEDGLRETRLRFQAADGMLPQAERDRTAALKDGVRQIVADMMPKWKQAIDEAENAIYEAVMAPLSEHCALGRFRERLNRLQGVKPDDVLFSCAKRPPATEPAPTG